MVYKTVLPDLGATSKPRVRMKEHQHSLKGRRRRKQLGVLLRIMQTPLPTVGHWQRGRIWQHHRKHSRQQQIHLCRMLLPRPAQHSGSRSMLVPILSTSR
jgi:hypothetical protein